MQNWNPPCTRYTVLIPQELKEACVWGTAFCESIQAWLQQLQWPLHPVPDDPGIAWLELFINWLVCSGTELPRVLKPSKDELAKLPKDTYAIRTSQQDPTVLLLPFTWTQAAKDFEGAIRVIQRRVENEFLPWNKRVKVNTLLIYGSKTKVSGFSTRPILSLQDQTMKMMLKGYTSGPEDVIQNLPLQHTCKVNMQPKECQESRYERFFKWRKLQDSNKGARKWH